MKTLWASTVPPSILVIGILAVARVASADEAPELVTDRPDQTESTAVVPPGSVQVEVGLGYERGDDGDVGIELLQGPATLVRVGLTQRVELRLGWDGRLEERREGGDRTRGSGDAELAAKIRVREGEGASPAVALLAGASVPLGDEPFSSERADPLLRLAVSHHLPAGIDLGWNVGVGAVSVPSEDGGRTTLSTGFYTVAAGFSAGERVGFFAELFGGVGLSAGGPPAHLLDGGVTYLARPNLQLDLAAGVGLSSAAPDWFAGVGVSFRLPR